MNLLYTNPPTNVDQNGPGSAAADQTLSLDNSAEILIITLIETIKTLKRASKRAKAAQRAGRGENLPVQQRRMDLRVAG